MLRGRPVGKDGKAEFECNKKRVQKGEIKKKKPKTCSYPVYTYCARYNIQMLQCFFKKTISPEGKRSMHSLQAMHFLAAVIKFIIFILMPPCIIFLVSVFELPNRFIFRDE